ncbi:MAG: NADH:ubiquinone reductase (Na(+)-transporting) subunit D [Flavobacteriales bacterium]
MSDYKKLLKDPMDDNNPITVQVLGICSALAITVQIEQAFIMSLSVLFVLVAGNMIVSAMRNIIPSRIRIIVQLVIVAALVIIVNEILKAYLPDVSEKLSVFVGLIITNCIIMGRLEAFALGNKVIPSFWDGVGNSLGYGLILVVVAFFRELLGSGKLYGYPIMENLGLYEMGYTNNNMMILPPMALITVGLIIWFQRARNKSLIEDK